MLLSREIQDRKKLHAAFLQYRAGLFAPSESLLLCLYNASDSCFAEPIDALLALNWLGAGSLASARKMIDRYDSSLQSNQIWFLCQQILAIRDYQFERVLDLGLPTRPHPLLRVYFAEAALWLSLIDDARQQINILSSEKSNVFEFFPLNARYFLLTGQPQKAKECLALLLNRTKGSELVWELAIHLLQYEEGGAASSALINRALASYPKSHRLHARQLLRLLLTRRPASARRHGLLQRLYTNQAISAQDQERSDANLSTAYEHLGRADLVPCLHWKTKARMVRNPQAIANNVLQLSSIAHPSYPESVRYLVSHLPPQAPFPLLGDRSSRKLRLGFLSPDFNYHPVGRFVAMMLGQGLGLGGDLHLVATGGREDPTTNLISDLASQQGFFHAVKGLPQSDQLERIRDLKLDIVVDLAGWTGENGGVLFASRVAPIQVNYLGYFASTGIPAMDFWLGDAALFPGPMQEWHSEQIWRLPRCFLAWQPLGNLPEGQVEVPAAPALSVPITFGSFNHARKLSAGTLRLWGELLRTVPGSRLALKSYTTDDPGTVQLLRQRMLRCGLDPERVLWLPTCPTAEEHLRQYGLVDIALDPFPNGGCTTTCEALWMGVPVITLRGDHYVSRMSTAVLQGAGMPEWIAASESEYLALAQRAAAERSNLRQTRANWRLRLQRSPLGDAAGLNQALWQAFAAMPAALKAG